MHACMLIYNKKCKEVWLKDLKKKKRNGPGGAISSSPRIICVRKKTGVYFVACFLILQGH